MVLPHDVKITIMLTVLMYHVLVCVLHVIQGMPVEEDRVTYVMWERSLMDLLVSCLFVLIIIMRRILKHVFVK